MLCPVERLTDALGGAAGLRSGGVQQAAEKTGLSFFRKGRGRNDVEALNCEKIFGAKKVRREEERQLDSSCCFIADAASVSPLTQRSSLPSRTTSQDLVQDTSVPTKSFGDFASESCLWQHSSFHWHQAPAVLSLPSQAHQAAVHCDQSVNDDEEARSFSCEQNPSARSRTQRDAFPSGERQQDFPYKWSEGPSPSHGGSGFSSVVGQAELSPYSDLDLARQECLGLGGSTSLSVSRGQRESSSGRRCLSDQCNEEHSALLAASFRKLTESVKKRLPGKKEGEKCAVWRNFCECLALLASSTSAQERRLIIEMDGTVPSNTSFHERTTGDAYCQLQRRGFLDTLGGTSSDGGVAGPLNDSVLHQRESGQLKNRMSSLVIGETGDANCRSVKTDGASHGGTDERSEMTRTHDEEAKGSVTDDIDSSGVGVGDVSRQVVEDTVLSEKPPAPSQVSEVLISAQLRNATTFDQSLSDNPVVLVESSSPGVCVLRQSSALAIGGAESSVFSDSRGNKVISQGTETTTAGRKGTSVSRDNHCDVQNADYSSWTGGVHDEGCRLIAQPGQLSVSENALKSNLESTMLLKSASPRVLSPRYFQAPFSHPGLEVVEGGISVESAVLGDRRRKIERREGGEEALEVSDAPAQIAAFATAALSGGAAPTGVKQEPLSNEARALLECGSTSQAPAVARNPPVLFLPARLLTEASSHRPAATPNDSNVSRLPPSPLSFESSVAETAPVRTASLSSHSSTLDGFFPLLLPQTALSISQRSNLLALGNVSSTSVPSASPAFEDLSAPFVQFKQHIHQTSDHLSCNDIDSCNVLTSSERQTEEERVLGVHWDPQRRRWYGMWYDAESGRKTKRSFSVGKYGTVRARELAIAARQLGVRNNARYTQGSSPTFMNSALFSTNARSLAFSSRDSAGIQTLTDRLAMLQTSKHRQHQAFELPIEGSLATDPSDVRMCEVQNRLESNDCDEYEDIEDDVESLLGSLGTSEGVNAVSLSLTGGERGGRPDDSHNTSQPQQQSQLQDNAGGRQRERYDQHLDEGEGRYPHEETTRGLAEGVRKTVGEARGAYSCQVHSNAADLKETSISNE